MKKVFMMLMLAALTAPAVACDVCGCSLGANYYGILPRFNKNFVGLRWSISSFRARVNIGSQYLNEENSHDTYRRAELFGRFYLNRRWQIFAFIPYNFNDMNGSEQKISASGLGDVSLTVNYLLFNTGDNKTSRWKHTLMAGGGIKLPTGDYTLRDAGSLVNRNFQMGTGSTDFLISSVYTIRFQQVGLTAEAGYKLNTRNGDDYLFGNQFHASGHLFFWKAMNSWSVLPNVGMYYEKGDQHRDGNIIQANTGGEFVMSSVGVETYFRNLTLGVNWKHPLSQHFHTDETAQVSGDDRWMVSLVYNFGRRE